MIDARATGGRRTSLARHDAHHSSAIVRERGASSRIEAIRLADEQGWL